MGNRVAIVECILAHYRELIYTVLSRQVDSEPRFSFFAAKTNNINSVKVIDFRKAYLPPHKGGLRWQFVRNIKLGGGVLWQTGLIRLALSPDFDTIIFDANPKHISTWVSCCIAKLKRKRILMWGHGFLWNEKGVKEWIKIMFFKLADGVLLYNNRARQIMIDKGFDPERLYVVYNSLDYDKQRQVCKSISDRQLSELRSKLFKKPHLPVLLWIGRLTPQKNLDMILKAAKLLKDDSIECNVLFVGNGQEKQKIVTLSHELGLQDNVHFYHACYSEEEIGPLISLADICVAPGEVGLTCMHCLVYGTPVITHDDSRYQGPEYEAITPGKSGAFFRRGNIDSLARTIEQWISEERDREVVAADCQEIIDKYYNPCYQLRVINAAVLGKPSKDVV